MAEAKLLWKYLGVDRPKNPRLTFFDNGLFRVTQPLVLNDPFEMKPRVLIEEFAEEDWTVARERARKDGMPEDDETIRMLYLEAYPTARIDETNFPGLFPARIADLREEPFSSVAEIDAARASKVQATVEQTLNESIGVFSVSEDPLHLLMWAHYGAEHWGAAVGLDLGHTFFNDVGSTLHQVEYLSKRVAVSSNGGLIRVAGHPVEKGGGTIPVATLLRKSPEWAYEREWRLIVRLARTDETHHGPGGEPIHLLRFPEAAIQTVVLGARLPDAQVAAIASRIRSDRRWQHVAIRRARLSPTEFRLVLEGGTLGDSRVRADGADSRPLALPPRQVGLRGEDRRVADARVQGR
jgi:hypothetical protein